MGQTIRELSKREVHSKPIFDNRFVVEICETVHFHYRNLRINLSYKDWLELAKGIRDSFLRHQAQGSPEPQPGRHIELCRKTVATDPISNNEIKVNLNNNLYVVNEGRVFSEGAEFKDQDYVHLKIRDLRIELTHQEFKALSEAIIEANEKLKNV